MNNKHHAAATALIAAFLSGCASTEEMTNVIPRVGGIYEVVATGEDKQETLASTLSAAEAECQKRGMRFIVLDRKEEYKGALLTETTHNVVNTVSEVAAATGNYVPSLSSDSDYRVTMLFKCESEPQLPQARNAVQ